jgi:hypothetical protein
MNRRCGERIPEGGKADLKLKVLKWEEKQIRMRLF